MTALWLQAHLGDFKALNWNIVLEFNLVTDNSNKCFTWDQMKYSKSSFDS